jgi:hypothetical protein
MLFLLLFAAGYLGCAGFLLAGLLWAIRKGNAVRIAPEPGAPPQEAPLPPVAPRLAKAPRRRASSELRKEGG